MRDTDLSAWNRKKARKKCALSAAIDLSETMDCCSRVSGTPRPHRGIASILGDTLLRLSQSNFAVSYFSRKKIFDRILPLEIPLIQTRYRLPASFGRRCLVTDASGPEILHRHDFESQHFVNCAGSTARVG
jgi:hypothetical protein